MLHIDHFFLLNLLSLPFSSSVIRFLIAIKSICHLLCLRFGHLSWCFTHIDRFLFSLYFKLECFLSSLLVLLFVLFSCCYQSRECWFRVFSYKIRFGRLVIDGGERVNVEFCNECVARGVLDHQAYLSRCLNSYEEFSKY